MILKALNHHILREETKITILKRANDEGSLPEIAQYSPYYLPLNVFAASKGSNLYILFDITAAGVVPCGGPKKSPRTSSIVQIIFHLGPLISGFFSNCSAIAWRSLSNEEGSLPEIAQYSPYYLLLNVLLLPKNQTFIFEPQRDKMYLRTF